MDDRRRAAPSVRTDSASSGVIALPPGRFRVLRRDLVVAPLVGALGALRGEISGIVADTSGAPIANARVVTDEVDDARTDSAGYFVMRGVPTGTRQLEVLAIGMSPAAVVVDVVAGRTATVGARLRRITTLDVVRVTASVAVRQRAERLEERRRLAGGYVRDSSNLGEHTSIASVLSTFPGTFVEPARNTSSGRFAVTMRSAKGDRCEPAVWIDTAPTDADHLSVLQPGEIAAIEVYPRAFAVPPEFMESKAQSRLCGAVAVWTKFFFRQ
jgi:hypothetical protein